MFEEIFFPRTAERYRAAPLVEQRERYLVHLKETGARRSTLRKCANDQLSLVRLLNLQEGGRVRLSQIEAATAIWSRPKARRCDRPASSKARSRFVSRAVRWLRFLGWLDEADDGSPSAMTPRLMPSKHGCASERGLSEATDSRLSRGRRSILRLAGRKRYALELRSGSTDIDDAIAAEQGAGDLRPTDDARLRAAS